MADVRLERFEVGLCLIERVVVGYARGLDCSAIDGWGTYCGDDSQGVSVPLEWTVKLLSRQLDF